MTPKNKHRSSTNPSSSRAEAFFSRSERPALSVVTGISPQKMPPRKRADPTNSRHATLRRLDRSQTRSHTMPMQEPSFHRRSGRKCFGATADDGREIFLSENLRYNRTAVFLTPRFAPLAQLDRASGYEPEGREFESLRAHHLFSHLQEITDSQLSARSAIAMVLLCAKSRLDPCKRC